MLNAAAPYVVAIFANSPVYEGTSTGCRSARAEVWRMLDPGRTGLPWTSAIPSGTIATSPCARRRSCFRSWTGASHLRRAAAPRAADARGVARAPEHAVSGSPAAATELRSCDAVSPQWYAALVALAVGITYDPGRCAAADLLGRPDLDLLRRAGRLGLGDDTIQRTAADLVDIALAGCGHLGPGYFHPSDLEQARLFFEQYTHRGRSPADDFAGAEIAA